MFIDTELSQIEEIDAEKVEGKGEDVDNGFKHDGLSG